MSEDRSGRQLISQAQGLPTSLAIKHKGPGEGTGPKGRLLFSGKAAALSLLYEETIG